MKESCKANRLSVPHLERELKRLRLLSSIAALEIIGGSEKIPGLIDGSKFGNSAIVDADDWHVIADIDEYTRLGVEVGNGLTLVKAKYSKRMLWDYYQSHRETFRIENGTVIFIISGIEIEMGPGSKLELPPRMLYSREFLFDTIAMITLPTSIIENL